jgi:hypothetical protein
MKTMGKNRQGEIQHTRLHVNIFRSGVGTVYTHVLGCGVLVVNGRIGYFSRLRGAGSWESHLVTLCACIAEFDNGDFNSSLACTTTFLIFKYCFNCDNASSGAIWAFIYPPLNVFAQVRSPGNASCQLIYKYSALS